MIRVALLLLLVTSPALAQHNAYLAADQMVEQVVYYPSRSAQSQTLGAGYPDITEYAVGDGKPRITSASFDASTTEVMDFAWHPLHHVTRTGTLYIDVHHAMATAHAGTVRLVCQMWRIGHDTDLASLGAATVSTSWTMDPSDAAHVNSANFYQIGYSGATNCGSIGVINLTNLGLNSIQNEVLVRFYREAGDATNDTHTGDLDVMRLEFHYRVNEKQLSIGE